jgi:APA family basic amino acid/polyamine antiporter
MRVRFKNPGEDPAYRTWGYPLTPLIFILGNLWIIYFSIRSRPAPVVWGMVTIAAGLGMYVYFNRTRSHTREKKVKNLPANQTLFSHRGEVGLKPTQPKEDQS